MSSYRSLTNTPKKRVPRLRDNIHGITSPGLHRLMLKGGMTARVSKEVYDQVRGYIRTFLEELLRKAVVYMMHSRRNTILLADVTSALQMLGRKSYGAGASTVKNCQVSSGTKVITKTATYQRQSDCVYLAKLPFSRFVREVLQDFHEDARLSAQALVEIQVSLENYLIGLFKKCALVLVHCDRQTLMPKDLILVSRLEKH